MFKNRHLYCLISLVLILVFTIVGCGKTTGTAETNLDSGVINKEYVGNVSPDVPKQHKLSEEEAKHGIQKITIKCGVETEIPAQNPGSDQQQQKEEGNSNEARPKI